tara:strand:+ start:53 stop:688 length:636 start_codon:yes stop_codon:yes gene_type:complete
MKQTKDKLNKNEWIVKNISIYRARELVTKLHYSKGATNTRVYTHGLFRKDESFWDSDCLGVAWWLPPTKNAANATYPYNWQKVLSLTRLAIEPSVPKNGASFLLSQSIKLIELEKKWECLVTYADTWQKHTGAIYKATNWEYMGETKPSPVFQNPDGKMMGRKRGSKNLTKKELSELGFNEIGKFSKHKFRFLLKGSKINKCTIPHPNTPE